MKEKKFDLAVRSSGAWTCSVIAHQLFDRGRAPGRRRASHALAVTPAQRLEARGSDTKGAVLQRGVPPPRLRFSECLCNPSRRAPGRQHTHTQAVVDELPGQHHALGRVLLCRRDLDLSVQHTSGSEDVHVPGAKRSVGLTEPWFPAGGVVTFCERNVHVSDPPVAEQPFEEGSWPRVTFTSGPLSVNTAG
ncbi:unnamed protein product [Pleuronectes platessa]|uniref:Uncharacterized protein n=1 Tax=Pleuronectes platessa TaxID=8262 RepID=A0A9N7W2S1_PLEPL|nr:unnamed protein product [Pleuronectes platessa]